MQMKTLVLANQKGGVGKSSTGTQLAFYAAREGLRVLYLDLDHQRHSTNPIVRSKLAVVAPFTASQLLRGPLSPLPEGAFVLVAGDDQLSGLEREPARHNDFANNLAGLLAANAARFDLCIIDTNPNPDIRYGVALVIANYVLSPVQLNQEALEGIGGLLNHARYGIRKIKQTLNAKLELIGILPNAVEPTPFQRENFAQLVQSYAQLLIPMGAGVGKYAFIAKRTAIPESQASGVPLFESKKTSSREAWSEIKPVFDVILSRMNLAKEKN